MKKEADSMQENVAYSGIYKKEKSSYADLKNIDDDNCYELIDGELYLMSSPTVIHQSICGEIYVQLKLFLKDKKCKAFISPLDVILSKNKNESKIYNVVEPDVFVVCDPKKIEQKNIFGAPDFVVEVLSKDRRHDILTKFNLYQKFGVKEYWIVDQENASIIPYFLNEKGIYEIGKIYDIKEEVPVKVLKGCKICLKNLYEENKKLF